MISALHCPPLDFCSTDQVGRVGQPVVFLFPGLSGDEHELAALRSGCEPALRLVLINYPDWTEIHKNRLDLDGLVEFCLAQIETHALQEPPLLAGYSFGGHIAFAVSEAIATSGHPVGLLVLLDTHAMPRLWSNGLSVAQHLRRLGDAFRNGAMTGRVGHIIAKALMGSRYQWPLNLFARWRFIKLPLRLNRHIDATLQMQFRLLVLRQLLDRMVASDAPLNSPAILFRCAEQPPGTADDLGWGRYFKALKVVSMPGNHFSLIQGSVTPSLCNSFISAVEQSGRYCLVSVPE